MKINNKSQFNQGVDQYKLLSSASGVGSLVATRMGTFIMPLSINNWNIVAKANRLIERQKQRGETTSKRDIEDEAIVVIEDPRFVDYLKATEGLSQLQYLLALPHMQLDEYNKQKVDENPLYKKYYASIPNESPKNHENDFVIPASVFPRWLYSEKTHKVQQFSEWKKQWIKNAKQTDYSFAPPRDPDFKVTHKKRDGDTYDEYGILKQMPLVLICKKGHISDIPWELFFRASIDSSVNVYKEGFDFRGYATHSCGCPKCNGGPHKLTYTESQNKASGWGLLKCTECGKVVSLEGIMNLRPKCLREMPWLGIDNDNIAQDRYVCKKEGTEEDSTMQVALLTSNGVYYADQVSSLYIKPSQQGIVLSDNQKELLKWIESTVYSNYSSKNPTSSRDSFWNQNKDSLMVLAGFSLPFTIDQNDLDTVGQIFLGQTSTCGSSDIKEQYRFEEYEVFSANSQLDIPQLQFKETVIPPQYSILNTFFKKITQVNTLCVTQTQMNFYRGTIPVVRLIQGSIVYQSGMKLYSGKPEEVYAYPVTQSFGEGLFFEFNEERLNKFSSILASVEPTRYSKRDYKMCSQLSAQLNKYGHAERFYLIHTFAHLIIKELEFSCGYPSASLAERIYYSDRMFGVLIYTTDGSEGSMGGLVWQGRPDLIYRTIINAIERAKACSSDPICWEHDEETMNYAACFSCSMISETSCEYRNFGLDRRTIIDEDYGYFSTSNRYDE